MLYRMNNYIHPSKSVIIMESNGYFEDFEIFDDKVYMYCSITLKNSSDNKKYVELLSIDNEDVKTGLLKGKNLLAYLQENGYSNPVIELSPNEEKTCEVAFIGEFAGAVLKFDRLIPDQINVIDVS